MIHVRVSRAPLAALLVAVLVPLTVSAGENAPPDNLAVSGTTFAWRDNSAGESGFQVSIMPIGGRGAPVYTHIVGQNVTSFDLATDPRACLGPIAVGLDALFPDGTVLNAANLVDADLGAACRPSPVSPGLPATGFAPARQAAVSTVIAILATAALISVAAGLGLRLAGRTAKGRSATLGVEATRIGNRSPVC